MRHTPVPVEVQRIALGDLIMADEGPAEVIQKEQAEGVNAPVRLGYQPRRGGHYVSQVYPDGSEEIGLLSASPLRPELERVAS